MKEILLYGSIYDDSVADIISKMEDAKDDDIRFRVNTYGGDVYQAYGLMAKFAEHKKAKTVVVDGIAASAGAIFCCIADSVECLDVSTFLFHRASMGYIENYPEYFTDDVKASLAKVNKQLRAFMEGKFTAEKWEKITKVSLDALFSLDGRLDVEITAQQAKSLGLVTKINVITQEKKAEIEKLVMKFAAYAIPKLPEANKENIILNTKKETMTKQEFKAQHPEAYAEIYNEGVSAEKDRVEAYMEFNDVDPVAVKAGIESGKNPSQKEYAAFARKAMAKNVVADMNAENPKDVKTAEIEKTETTPEAAKATADFTAEWKSAAGISAAKA